MFSPCHYPRKLKPNHKKNFFFEQGMKNDIFFYLESIFIVWDMHTMQILRYFSFYYYFYFFYFFFSHHLNVQEYENFQALCDTHHEEKQYGLSK